MTEKNEDIMTLVDKIISDSIRKYLGKTTLSADEINDIGRKAFFDAMDAYDRKKLAADGSEEVFDINRFTNYVGLVVTHHIRIAVSENPKQNAVDSEISIEPTLEVPAKKESLDPSLLDGIDRLPINEREVIVQYHGLDGGQPKSLTQIATERDISRARVHQIKNAATTRLQRIKLKSDVESIKGQSLGSSGETETDMPKLKTTKLNRETEGRENNG